MKRYKINNFILETEVKKIPEYGKIKNRKTGKIEEKILQISVPMNVSVNGKIDDYSLVEKTRNFTVFSSLEFFDFEDEKYYIVISNIYDMIDLVELLKAFSSKKLDVDKTYELNNSFTGRIEDGKNKNKVLEIHFKNFKNPLKLDRLECSIFATKFSKILNKCEVESDSENHD